MMDGFRKQPPLQLGGSAVVEVLDFEKQIGRNIKTGEQWSLTLPTSNVIQFVLENESVISARPSGTEPKIKFYFSVKENLTTANQFDQVGDQLRKRIKSIITDLNV
jgi:phosphoglucomutase